MEKEILICECNTPEHQIIVTYCSEDRGEDIMDEHGIIYEDCIDIRIHLNTQNSFFKRLWIGIKYAFGYKSQYGHWDDFLLDPSDVDRIIPYLIKLKNNNELVKAKTFERDNQF